VRATFLMAAAACAAVAAAHAQTAPSIQFIDVTKTAGIRFVHNSGKAGQKLLPETLGSGAAFFDADRDGWPDLLFVNGRDWKAGKRKSLHGLYRNNRNGTFTDVTAASGLDVEMFGLGVAVADFDNDGLDDVYITALEGDRLFRNEGGFKFRDVTKAAGIANASFGTSAAWLDYDKDGHADLFVANYVKWTREGDLWCSLDGTHKSYCTPESYKGTASKLYRNLGGGRFADVSAKAGIADPTSKSLGIAVFDYDMDGWPDLFVANDTQPNKLYRNNRNGTFTEEGVAAGVAYSEDGVARAGMGVDVADYDRSGRPHLVIGNFANEMTALYHNEGTRLFVDEAQRSTVGRSSLLALTFGTFFFDYDLDGHPDIFSANGHIEEEIERVQPKVRYRQAPLMFRNLGGGRFDSVGSSLGKDFNVPMVARGAAYADYDRDGDLDVVITDNHGPARLLRNEGGNRNSWIAVKLAGTKTNRSALGAIVRVQSASGKQWNTVRSGSSYCSQSDLTQTFGLGKDAQVQSIDVEWPSGLKDRIANVKPNQILTIVEGKGVQPAAANGTR
jgi:hypothetical protein